MILRVCFWVLALNFIEIYCNAQIELEETTLHGVVLNSFSGKEFYGFLGIPYAQPPVGSLRFANPVPLYLPPGVFDATDDSVVCPQWRESNGKGGIVGQEDCLYLNVYIPKNSEKTKLDVLVWIHGGAWLVGAGTRSWFGPEYLFEHDDIILVTLNYRLGALGFLSTEDVNIPGNFGLKDQQRALMWVQEFIHHFGGNPDSVTLCGASAGSASVHYHTFAPGSRGLFHRIILQSGTAFQFWAQYEEGKARSVAVKFAQQFGCPSHNSKAILSCLKTISAEELVCMSNFLYVFANDPIIPFRPVYTEPLIDGAFLTKDPITITEHREALDVPWMVGITSEEGATKAAAILNNRELLKELNENIDKIFPITFGYASTTSDIERMNKFMLGHYLHHRPIDKAVYKELTWAYSDSLILSGVDFAIRFQKLYLTAPVYYYTFGYRGTMSYTDIFTENINTNYGVAHGDDLFYLFKQDPYLFFGKSMSEDDIKMMKIWTRMYIDFAKTGVPYKDAWEPTTLPFLQYLDIKSPDNLKMSGEKNLNGLRASFWYRYPTNKKINFIMSQMDHVLPGLTKTKKGDEL